MAGVHRQTDPVTPNVSYKTKGPGSCPAPQHSPAQTWQPPADPAGG